MMGCIRMMIMQTHQHESAVDICNETRDTTRYTHLDDYEIWNDKKHNDDWEQKRMLNDVTEWFARYGDGTEMMMERMVMATLMIQSSKPELSVIQSCHYNRCLDEGSRRGDAWFGDRMKRKVADRDVTEDDELIATGKLKKIGLYRNSYTHTKSNENIMENVYSTFLRNEHPSVRRALPPVGWQRTVEQEAQNTTVAAWENIVVIWKQPGHLTSIKNELGDWTKRFNLCWRDS